MRTRSREGFTTITTEGSILPPDLLARIVERDRDLDGLDPGSYHLAGQTLNEAISRSWNVLQGAWNTFKDRRAELPEGQPDTGMTRERWLLPLFRELDYGRLETMRAVEIEGKSYPISHRWRHTPIHLVGFRTDLDKRTPGVAGAARVSPHGLVQEFLNRSEDHLWAFLSDGLRLRILRDNASLTRQAYVEFDLEAMMDGEVYPDFVLLWLLCHQSRVEAERPEECYLEQWSHAASQQGTRALEGLRGGVEEAIASLGSGFLSHRANDELKARLRSGELEAQDYYRQLLRLVYRLLFLFVAEDRGLLLDPEADAAAKDRYTRYYSTRKLRDVAEKRVGARHSDLYRALSLVMGKLGDEDGCPELGLPALGGFLFGPEAMPDLAGAEVSNHALLDAVRALSLVDYDGSRRPVDYKNLGAEELGSVYESLLELQPELDPASGAFTLRAVTGNERKTTGSYYTPHSLVTSLLDTALDPVLDEAAKKPDPEAAILDLKVCDPAVGSGHFLIAAAHRMARRLASVRTGDDEPSPDATREALRDVIGRCLYGVDVNPMAAELCKVSLWMEALVPGRPLSFLDHHIRVGNSLLGTTPDLISSGIPNDAFKPIVGDDNKLTSAYKKRNREERAAWESGQLAFSLRTLDKNREAIERGYEEIEAGEENSVAAVREKAARYAALLDSEEMFHARRLADAWCAAFVWPKREGAPEAITQEVFAELTLNAHALPRETEREIERIAERYNLFHWHLAFPNVFGEDGGGGFAVVLGNPPWERIKLQEQEWFAARRPEISTAPNAAARKRMIKALVEEDPALHAAYLEDLRRADGESHLIRSSGRFPLCGRGDINTYSIFAETNRSVISPTGRVGCIVPSGIATDNTTKEFFGDLVDTKTLASLYDFENRKAIFPGVHRSYKFSLLTMTGKDRPVGAADYAFFALDIADLKDPERRFPLSAEDIRLLNPNTRTCPIFRTRRDAEITKEIYRRVPVLINESGESGVGSREEDDSRLTTHDSRGEAANPWGITFLRMFDMSNDSGLFRTREELEADGWELAESGNVFHKGGKRYLPLYEAKMLHHYDHRWATYSPIGDTRDLILSEKQDPATVVMPRYWVPGREVDERLDNGWRFPWLLGWRKTCRATDERTLIAAPFMLAGAGDKYQLMFPDPEQHRAADQGVLLASLDSFVCDFAARQKLGGTDLSYFVYKQLPVLPPDAYDGAVPWDESATLRDWISSRVLELTYTAWDLAPFARDLWRESGVENSESSPEGGGEGPRLSTRDSRLNLIKRWEANHGRSIFSVVQGSAGVGGKHEPGGVGLQGDKGVSQRRDIRNDLADPASGDGDPGEHSGGIRERESGRVHPIPPDSSRFAQGTGDIPAAGGQSRTDDERKRGSHPPTMRDRGQDAPGPDPLDTEKKESRESGIVSREEHDSLLSNPDSPLPPFRWDPERRFSIRCELDAAFFHLYGIAREDVEYIMETFPIVKRKDEAAHGEYRTKRVILEIYDHMAATMREAAPETEPPPATVTRLHPRPRDERRDEPAPEQPTGPPPQQTPSLPLAAESRSRYAPPSRHPDPEEEIDDTPQKASSPNGVEQPQPTRDPEADPAPLPEAPNPYDAALALNACVPDGQKVECETLLHDAARELGHPKLTRKVRRALNKALNAEHNAGRLKTDWQLVWKPMKK